MARVVIIGARGKMGGIAQNVFKSSKDFEIVAMPTKNDDLLQILSSSKPDFVMELGGTENLYDRVKMIMDQGVKIVIGSSGLSNDQILRIKNKSHGLKLGALLVPNFSPAVLDFFRFVSVFASQLSTESNYKIEIIESHHTGKKDKPSGTARHIASLLNIPEDDIISIRDDDYHAKHDVVITRMGERIVLSVDTKSRDAYADGLLKSGHIIQSLKDFKIGLD